MNVESLRRIGSLKELPIILMTIGIFVVSAIFASGSVSGAALTTMLPLAGVLMIASTGQSLVIQQRGIDLSGAAMLSFGATIASVYCHGDSGRLAAAIVIAVLVGLVVGILNGAMVVVGLVSIVATLAMYELLQGVIQTYANGASQSVPGALARFSIGKFLGIPNVLYVSVIVVIVVALAMAATRAGHKFVATGVNIRASIAAGTRTRPQVLAAYALCSAAYAVSGVLLAGYVTTPAPNIGNNYLLAPIAIVILAGNSFGAAKISIIATALGALFYTQLGQFTLSLGAPSSSQLYIQSIGIMALPVTRWTLHAIGRLRHSRRPLTAVASAGRPA
jgi:ribose transport system permease protein